VSGRDLDETELEAATPEAIYACAADRGRAMGLGYAGALTPREAFRLHETGAGIIVDVRTLPEWEFVGRVPDTILIEWRRFHEQGPNADFLRELAARCTHDEPVLFLCRSAVRSHHAAEAAARAGFSRAYNVLEGFEGNLDARRQRGALGGWRAAGLPWEQS
jgi:rhodanese-related sulfurtransferase